MKLIIENLDYVVGNLEVTTHQTITIRDGAIESIDDHDARGNDALRNETGKNKTSKHETRDQRVLDGRGKAAVAGFKNAHTHGAMTLLRGYGDDMRLQPWLEERIWPAEAELTGEDIYWGTRLAALEMIRSGTTFANDMYFQAPQVARAFRDAGMSASVGLPLFDFGDPRRRDEVQQAAGAVLDAWKEKTPPSAGENRVFPTIAPHSIYTCSGELLQWAAKKALEYDLVFHIHMSETEQEVNDCVLAHGVRPFEWLEQLGILDQLKERIVAAHAIWLSEHELDLVARHGVTVVHNPASNMKLASGCFPWLEYHNRNVPIMLAPDGVASNNNLDMFDEMKLAGLLQKHHYSDPTRLPAEEILAIATGARSEVFRAGGVGGAIAPGEPADLFLVDLDHPQLVPVHNLESNLAYAANGSVVDTVICGGNLLMEGGRVPDTETVLQEARRRALELVKRARKDFDHH